MKIADPHIIENSEKNLIDAVKADLNLDAVRQILRDKAGVSSLSSRGGQIVVHDNQIAFKLDFDLKLRGSLLFDRQGNYLDVSDDASLEPDPEEMLADNSQTASLETGLEQIDLDEPDLEENLSIDLPEYDLEQEPEFELELTDPVDPADEPLVQEEMLDDDINDILKESRDFWDQKKE